MRVAVVLILCLSSLPLFPQDAPVAPSRKKPMLPPPLLPVGPPGTGTNANTGANTNTGINGAATATTSPTGSTAVPSARSPAVQAKRPVHSQAQAGWQSDSKSRAEYVNRNGTVCGSVLPVSGSWKAETFPMHGADKKVKDIFSTRAIAMDKVAVNCVRPEDVARIAGKGK